MFRRHRHYHHHRRHRLRHYHHHRRHRHPHYHHRRRHRCDIIIIGIVVFALMHGDPQPEKNRVTFLLCSSTYLVLSNLRLEI